jgi:hypothetical protein
MVLRRKALVTIVNVTQRCHNMEATAHTVQCFPQSAHIKHIIDCHKLRPPPLPVCQQLQLSAIPSLIRKQRQG